MKSSHPKRDITGPWQLTKESWRVYRKGFKNFALVVLIVTLPVNVLTIWLASDATFAVYSSLASVIMNLALLYTITRRLDSSRTVTLRQAYYDGTAGFVRFVLTGVALVAAIIPAVIGLFLFSAEQSAAALAATTLAQDAVVALVAILIALPSAWFITRWAFALVIVVDEGAHPVAALRASRQRTLGVFWRTLGRLCFLLLILLLITLVVVVPPAVVSGLIPGLGFANQIFQTLFTVVGLPLANIYLVLLSRNLAFKKQTVKKESKSASDLLEPEPIIEAAAS